MSYRPHRSRQPGARRRRVRGGLRCIIVLAISIWRLIYLFIWDGYIYVCKFMYVNWLTNNSYTCLKMALRVHPVSVRRFPSFRTQPLENLSHYLWRNGFLSNPAPGENLLSGNLVMETGCIIKRLLLSLVSLSLLLLQFDYYYWYHYHDHSIITITL